MSFRAQKACKKIPYTDPQTGTKTSMSPSTFCYPKFRRMGTCEKTIRLLGNGNLTSTGYGECSHADIKHAFPSPTSIAGQQLISR